MNTSEDNIIDVIKILFKRKKLLLSITFSFALGSIVYSLALPNKYTSEATLMPSDDNQSIPSSYSSLANIAGVNLNDSSFSRSDYAKQYILSREFVDMVVNKYDLEIPLMAGKKIDLEGKLIIDQSIYDIENQEWIDYGENNDKPTNEDIYEKWIEEIFILKTDKETGFINISVTFLSPEIANDWAKIILYEINESVRKRDIDSADAAIKFLKKEYENNDLYDLRASITSLLEKEIEKKMLANSKKEYAFVIVDPPSKPVKKSKPSRAIIVILSTLLGVVVSIITIIGYTLFFKKT